MSKRSHDSHATAGFVPYANEADVLHIGQLEIENRLDRIELHGDLSLCADQQGLRDARALHALLGAIVASLEGQTLPEHLPPPKAGRVDNPFE